MFRRFRRQLFHSSITAIFQSLRPAMSKPIIMKCADGHLRRVIFGFGPYIADYPEQVLLACVVQDWCPRCVLVRDQAFKLVLMLNAGACRCTALPHNLDGQGGPRTQEHRESLLESMTLKQMWDYYGYIGDVNVSPKSNASVAETVR